MIYTKKFQCFGNREDLQDPRGILMTLDSREIDLSENEKDEIKDALYALFQYKKGSNLPDAPERFHLATHQYDVKIEFINFEYYENRLKEEGIDEEIKKQNDLEWCLQVG